MNESPRINDILQRLTVKVEARLDGAGIICKFSETAEQVFILTAKHNLCGTRFRDDPDWKKILISFLWDTQSSPPQYSSYKIQSSDRILCSEDDEDIAVLVVNCSDIENLVGKLPVTRLTDNPESFRDIIFRGFPAAYLGDTAVRMDGSFVEKGQPHPYSIQIKIPDALAAKWFHSDIKERRTALVNSKGFSGSGLFMKANDDIFLMGIVLRLGRLNRFFCTNVGQIKALLEQAALPQPIFHAMGLPFTSKQVLTLDQFVKEYENSRLATPLSNAFFGRENELRELGNSVMSHTITIVTGAGGVGKTRLCREVATQFEYEHPDFTTFCIVNKFDTIYYDLRLIFDSDKNYLILIDDANRQSEHLKQILAIMQEPRLGQIRLIITVRNYACDLIEKACLAYSQDTVEIEKMTDEAITTILESADFGIPYSDLKKMLTIADGNPRLAIMAAKVVLEQQSSEVLNNVSDIFELYYSTFLYDHKELSDLNVRKTLGLIGFFHVIDLDHDAFYKTLLEQFDLDFKAFKSNIDLLESLELVEFSEDKNIVRIAEQNLGNYFFFCCFIRDGLLPFETLLLHYFKTHKKRFTEGVISANNHFGWEVVKDKLTPTIRKHFQENKYKDIPHTVKFLELFWFYLSDETLSFIEDTIESMQVPHSFEFKVGDNNHRHSTNNENQFMELLRRFLMYPFTTHFEVAVELGFENVRRQPKLMSEWIKILTNTVAFDYTDARTEFFRQTKLFDVLISNIQEGKPEYEFAFFPLATFFLNTEFSIQKNERGHKVAFYQYPIPFIETIKAFRAKIWLFLSNNYPMNSEAINNLIAKYYTYFRKNNKQFAEFDSDFIFSLIQTQLDVNDVSHCILVHEYCFRLSKFTEIETPESAKLKIRFRNERFEWLTILNKSQYYNKERSNFSDFKARYKDFLKLKEEEIKLSFEFSNLSEFVGFYNAYLEFIVNKNLSQYDLKPPCPLDIILAKHWKKDKVLCLSFIKHIILKNEVNHYVPYQVLMAAFTDLEQTKTLYQLIKKHEFKGKDNWLLQFFNFLPTELVNSNFYNDFMSLLKNLETPSVFNAEMLEKFIFLNPKIYSDWLKIVVKKNKKGLIIQLWSDFFETYLERFSDTDLNNIKQAYFQQVSNQNYFDFEYKVFFEILKRDISFLEDFIKFEHRDNYRLNQADQHTQLGIIWELDNAESMIEQGIILSRSLVEVYVSPFEFYANVFFYGIKPEHTERAKLFLMDFVSRHSTEVELMQVIINIVKTSFRDLYETVFKHYLSLNQDSNDFKKIKWQDRKSGVIEGRGIIFGDMEAYELNTILKWIEEMPKPTKYTRHKAYLTEYIGYANANAKDERRWNFSRDDF
jgi:hypothetical protein